MSSDRRQRKNQVILVCDLRDFLETLSIVSGDDSETGNNMESKFYNYMDFYLKGFIQMLSVSLEFLKGKQLQVKKDITSNVLFNSTGDGVVLVIGGKSPENVMVSYIYSFYLDCLLKRFCKKLEEEFNLPKLKRRVGIALAYGDVTEVQYLYQLPGTKEKNSDFYAATSLLSEKINIAARVESMNKDHASADISLDSSFVEQLYRLMFSGDMSPKKMMKDFKNLKTKQERLAILNLLNANDIDLMIDYLGHHYFKGGDTVVHIVSPVLVEITADLKQNKVHESEEVNEFYHAVNKRMKGDVITEVVVPMRTKLLEMLRELDRL